MTVVRPKGLPQALKAANKEIVKLKGATMAGLLAAGFIAMKESNRRIPREHGNLAGSQYNRKAQDGTMKVEFGYHAAYALALHENLEMKWKGLPRKSGLGEYWGPSGEARYLVNSVRDKKREMADIIAHYASKGEAGSKTGGAK